ncbi:MAG TPA: hypothetical protein VNP98_17220 [Chthoniobacterales bacterium]|nr:hypothetical protein [Chthoniobacterales bacterium]
MLPGAVPQDIVELHRTLLRALNVDFFQPGLAELGYWREFLFVMKPLDESEGGAFTKDDIAPVIRIMREDNKRGSSNWSLRFSKIMRDPENFRDLVLIARKKVRPRPPVEQKQRTDATGANIAVDHDPAAERDPVAIAEHINEWKRKMRGPGQTRQDSHD